MKNLSFYLLVIPNLILTTLVLLSGFLVKNKLNKQRNSLSVIDQLNHYSKLSGVNTGYKLLISLSLLVFCLLNSNIQVSIFVILLTTVIIIYFGKISLGQYLKLFIIPLSFLVLSCIAIVLNFAPHLSDNTVVSIKLWSTYCFITRTSLIHSLTVFFRVLACISSLYFLIVNTPIDKILACLKRYHFPNVLIELMFLIYRFIFFLWEISSQMVTSAKLRFGFDSYPKTIKSIGLIGSNVFIVSFKKAQKFYNSMESRLYNGSLNFIFTEPKVTLVEIALFVLVICYLSFLYYNFQ